MKHYFYSIAIATVASFSFLYAQLPNLVVSSGQFTPSSTNQAGQISITATVQNNGIVKSTPSHLSYYISSSSNISTGVLLGCVSVEPLVAGGVSESKNIIISLPASVSSGIYYVGWVVDPFKEVTESSENNGFYISSDYLNVSGGLITTRHIPYPIIFIHGLNSNDQTWSTFLTQLDSLGLSSGGRMDYCLNYDANTASAFFSADYHDFTSLSTLRNADYYTINFDVNSNGSVYNNSVQSNMSAIYKQGKAIQSAIKHVLDITGTEKVILVGHSMGGLASREYIQNTANWQADGNHHVAKLLTIGTPHGGSNQWTFGVLDGYSEAIRDLRWSYSNGNAGVFLYGGNENNLNSLGFHNVDVNCNGTAGNNIVGLNQKDLYVNLIYTCIIGTGGLSGDGVVDATRANLNNYYAISADTFQVEALHTSLPSRIIPNLQGLDEPTYFQQAYSIDMNKLYYGSITNQSMANQFTDDYDDYSFRLETKSKLNIQIGNIVVPQMSVSVFDSLYNLVSFNFSNTMSKMDTNIELNAGKYYLEVQAQPTSYSWRFPYTIKLLSTPISGVDYSVAQVPDKFNLLQNYPNPFNGSTNISFDIPSKTYVSIKVFDMLGRELANIISQDVAEGRHTVQWDASQYSSGTFFYRIQAGDFAQTKKMILMK